MINLTFLVIGIPLSAQLNANRLAPGAVDQLTRLLNTPGMVSPATATPLGKSWYRLETDAHVFTDEVSVRQVAAVLIDFDNMDDFFNGKRSSIKTKIISSNPNETIVDTVTISRGPLGIQIKTPAITSLRISENTGSRVTLEIRQLPSDSESNRNLKGLYALRHAEEVFINGRSYTYIRMYTMNEVNTHILPNAKKILERNAFPVVEEVLYMIIDAARSK